MKMKIIKAPLLILLFVGIGTGQDMKPFDLTNEWLAKIENIAPSIARIPLAKKKKVLIFSLHTGYEHWTIPHTEAVMKMIGNKSNAYEMQTSKDIKVFNMKNLKKFDAIILNNNCPIDDKRNLFWDKLKEDESLNDKQRLKKADKLEQNILKYVKKGGGLVALHGGIIMQNKSPKFGEMVGGSFDYHPKQQMIQVKLMDKTHPLLQAFNGEGFKHIDEPYMFNNVYFDYNFRPLLYMEADKLEGKKEEVKDNIKYISWIKKYGKGRIFYSSPSHNAQSFENPSLLQFFLDGLQYASGDLKCDDTPLSNR